MRHGHVEGIAPERFRGRADLPLTPLGLAQASAVAARIAEQWRPSAVFSAPLSRTVATADAIGRAIGVDVVAVPELDDIDYGAWLGLTREEAALRWPDELEMWYRAPDLIAIPGGETLAEVLARAGRTLTQILRERRGDTVVIVGHSVVNRVLLLHALGLPLRAFWHIVQDPCGLSELGYEAGGQFFVRTMNETYHLAGLPPMIGVEE